MIPNRFQPAAAVAAASVMMFSAPRPESMEAALLSRIVEAQAAADEANDLASLGVIDHARYEQAARDRDDAVEAAAEFLGRAGR